MCGFEVSDLLTLKEEYDNDVEFVVIVFDKDAQMDPADIAYAEEYAKRYNISFRVGIDPNRINFYKYFDMNATPYTMAVAADGMIIKYATMGWDYGDSGAMAALKGVIDEVLTD